MYFWEIAIILAIPFGFICKFIGDEKGQKGCFLYGLLLGIFGLIIVLCLKDKSNEIAQNNFQNVNNSSLNVPDKYEQLAKLQELKEKGVLTEEEFKTEKMKLLK